MLILFGVLLLAAAFWLFRAWSKRSATARQLASPLTPSQRALVARHVPLTRKLPADVSRNLEGRINRFLEQIEFIGCDGLEVTDEMRLSIAAQACLLVVNTNTWYDNLRTILVYPGAFKSIKASRSGYVVTEREIVRSGESWARGPVVLSWAHTEQGAADTTDGHNVVFHEFAHQIDDMSGRADGAPILAKGQRFAEWERVFLDGYNRHLARIEHGRKSVLDAYGAQSHEEFFAVSVEAFFEKPGALMREEPEIYDQLAQLFRLEPANWK